jgi:transposase InsO family protein
VSRRLAITVIDYHSRWPEVHFCGTVTSQVVIKCLTDLFAQWSIPKVLVSDNSVQFTSHEFESFLKQCDIKHVKTSLYFPQSNGLIERFNRSLKEAVGISVAEGKAVETGVRDMLVTFRSTAQPATGVSPAQLMIGRQLRVPANSFKVAEQPHSEKRVRFAEDVSTTVSHHQQKMAEQFNRRHRACKLRFAVND